MRALRYGILQHLSGPCWVPFVGLLLSGVIAAFLEPDHVKAVFGGGLLPYVLAMALRRAPPVCATASTPIAASLIAVGLSPGAALVFLISGPATNVASVTTLIRILGGKVVAVYLGTVIVGSLATGLLVDFVLGGWVLTGMPAAAIEAVHHHADGPMAMNWGFKEICAVVLLAVLTAAMWPRRAQGSEENPAAENGQDHMELSVGGMRCNGCVTSIGRALSEVEGVEDVKVDLSTSKAPVAGIDLDPAVLCAEVEALGFDCE